VLEVKVKGGSWTKRKRLTLGLFFALVAGFLLCLPLRFVPKINDALSGRPEFMRHVASHVAAALAAQQQYQVPVVLAGEEKQDCRLVPNATGFEEQIYIVITYSESRHSFCMLQYAPAAGLQEAQVITLTEESGRNYGAPFLSPVKVVPVGHVFKALPDFVMSMLDWRSKLKQSGGTIPFDSKTDASSSAASTTVGLDFNLFDIRAAVAKKHERINLILNFFLAGLLLLIFAAAGANWTIYQRYRSALLAYSCESSIREFVRLDLDSFIADAQQSFRNKQSELQAQARAESIAHRELEELRERLQVLSAMVGDESQRQRIEDCLDRNSAEAMEALCDELGSHSNIRTPEDRLALLLESLKEYCDPQRFQEHRTEAQRILESNGFRAAREFVVQAHTDLKRTYRDLEERKAGNATESPNVA
jgi:hypothetical protein